MKKFLAIYLGTTGAFEKSSWARLDDATRRKREAEGIAAWGAWVAKNQAAIVDTGTPLGKTLRAAAGGIDATRNAMTAYTIVQAESHAAAAKLFENHPHFAIFPGESIEIMECLPIPGQ